MTLASEKVASMPCMTAWEKTYEFEKLGLGKADVLKALDKLPGSVPASVEDAVDTWAAFTQEWYLRYQDLVERHTSVQAGASCVYRDSSRPVADLVPYIVEGPAIGQSHAGRLKTQCRATHAATITASTT